MMMIGGGVGVEGFLRNDIVVVPITPIFQTGLGLSLSWVGGEPTPNILPNFFLILRRCIIRKPFPTCHTHPILVVPLRLGMWRLWCSSPAPWW